MDHPSPSSVLGCPATKAHQFTTLYTAFPKHFFRTCFPKQTRQRRQEVILWQETVQKREELSEHLCTLLPPYLRTDLTHMALGYNLYFLFIILLTSAFFCSYLENPNLRIGKST